MARKLRLEYEGARYHVINRGNYRADVFATEGARQAFETCLWEACEKTGWVVHAYVIMRNHYHLALETPAANLVDGMRWLQSTFANRFNRLRGENGHVFQGRYRAILIEDADILGAVGHYIHLNPVRARIVVAEAMAQYRWSSFHFLRQPRKRPPAVSFAAVLAAAGDLRDTAADWRRYHEFLTWLAEDELAQKTLRFDELSRGWAIGTRAFKQSLIEEHKEELGRLQTGEAETREARDLSWQTALAACLERLGKTTADAPTDRKAAPWKVAIASHLKLVSTAKNPWLAEQLHMGDPDGVSRYVSELRQGLRPDASGLAKKISDIRV